MERLTEKSKYGYRAKDGDYKFATQKLGKLEDLLELYEIEDLKQLEFLISKNIENKMVKINEPDLDDYLINKKGDIYSYKKQSFLKPSTNNDGYTYVMINKKQRLIHRLVAKTFIDNPNNYKEVNHKNEIKNDNRAENLEWCSRKYNATYNNCHLRHSDWEKKPILQFDVKGNFIKKWNYAKEIEEAGIASASCVKQCCRNVLSISGGYVWRFDGDTFETRRIRKEYDRARNFRKSK